MPNAVPSDPESNETELDVRLSDQVFVAMDGESILIANRLTGANRIWPRGYEERLNRYTKWQSVSAVFCELIDEGGEQTRLNEELDLIHDLLAIEVLVDRKSDLSGEQLESPGNGWETALKFILATRTTRDTVFALPEEYNAALAEKSKVSRQPSAFYERTGAKIFPLDIPRKQIDQPISYEHVLLSRRTSRRFADSPVSRSQLSELLYFGWGMTGQVENPLNDVFLRKTSPSGGSLHPIEVYPIILNVDGVPRGIYHYSVRRHALEQIALESPEQWIVEASGDQRWVSEAGVVFLCTAFLPRTAWKYQYSRVLRAIMSEVGYSGQSLMLTATWLGLGSFTTIALRDEIWEQKLGLNPIREPVLSIIGVGALEADVDDHSRPRYESAPGVTDS